MTERCAQKAQLTLDLNVLVNLVVASSWEPPSTWVTPFARVRSGRAKKVPVRPEAAKLAAHEDELPDRRTTLHSVGY